MQNSLSQRERLGALLIDLSVLVILCKIGFDSFVPPLGSTGMWFYAALLSSVIGSKLITPYFVKPVDAISYSLTAFVTLVLISDVESWANTIKAFYFGLVFVNGLVIFLGLLAIFLNNSVNKYKQEVSNILRLFLELLGKPQFIYLPVIVLSIFAYHTSSVSQVISIFIAAILTVVTSAGEWIIRALKRFKISRKNDAIEDVVGELVAIQEPNMYLIKKLENKNLPLNSIFFVKHQDIESKLLLSLDNVGHDQGVLVRAVEIASFSRGRYNKIETLISDGDLVLLARDTLSEIQQSERIAINYYSNAVGIVTSDSTIETLFFEVVNNADLESGRLVSVNVSGKKVLYQVVDGLTKEESVQKKNTYGFLRVQAQQVGVWQEADQKFSQYNWLPMINSPVFLERTTEFQIEAATVGHFPNTNYQIKIGNINHLVTHNTAILGILGVGKSMLAIELLERMMAGGIKVICLDLTNQYANELSDYYDIAHEAQCFERIRQAAQVDLDNVAESPEEGGSRNNLINAFRADLEEFINGNSGRLLKIYNPAQITASRQDRAPASVNQGGNWARLAPMYSLTPVEVTQIVSEAALQILSAEMSDYAKVCLVYEEAHSLVPEWNSVVSDGDKHATSGTARAILQGRKFGLGCLLITQRTANVTKTILNQCNTIFAMRTFDETGKEFLSNYLGHNYAHALSTLKERHAVFFGRGSSCENPVLIKLNNRDDFRDSFRAQHPPPQFAAQAEVVEEQEQIPITDIEDDIPF